MHRSRLHTRLSRHARRLAFDVCRLSAHACYGLAEAAHSAGDRCFDAAERRILRPGWKARAEPVDVEALIASLRVEDEA